MKYRCKVCGMEADIDVALKTVKVAWSPGEPTKFPKHRDCELAKPVEEVDLSKLERAG